MLGRLVDQLLPVHVYEPEEARHVASFLARNPKLRGYSHKSPWGSVLPLLEDTDLNIINLETSVTSGGRKWPDKVFNYRMHPDNLKVLRPARIDCASLANNHTLDFSESGLRDTIASLEREGISFAGVGLNEEDCTKPALLEMPSSLHKTPKETDKHKVAVWSAADHPQEWIGVRGFNLIDYSSKTRNRLKNSISQLTEDNVSLKVFSVHWGPNYCWHPAAEIRSLAHFLIDECGIDIVHGHSSHHIQGVEIYQGKLIIYGCGDFVDDYALNPDYRNDISAVWRVHLNQHEDRLMLNKLEVYPTKIQNFQAERLSRQEPDHAWAVGKFRQLCEEFGTQVENDVGPQDQIVVNLNGSGIM